MAKKPIKKLKAIPLSVAEQLNICAVAQKLAMERVDKMSQKTPAYKLVRKSAAKHLKLLEDAADKIDGLEADIYEIIRVAYQNPNALLKFVKDNYKWPVKNERGFNVTK